MECKVRDLNIYYEEVGSGRPVLILHGGGGDHRYLFHHMEPIFKNRDGWRRLYPDLPGHGKTRSADWITSQDHMLDVAQEFMDAIAPGERFVVMGYSYGGYLARGVVFRRAEQLDGLLLLAPSIVVEEGKSKVPKHRILREDANFLAALTSDEQDLRGIYVAQSMDVLEIFRNTLAPAFAVADHEFLARLKPSFTFEVDSLANPFPAPTLILTGRYDPWVGYQNAYEILDNYPRGTYIVLDRAGHGLADEQQTLFRALVNEWLDRVEEYAINTTSYHS
jgi:pimeloyl-ACP methyl ester carboxylesterase